jgi:hypothetical protein
MANQSMRERRRKELEATELVRLVSTYRRIAELDETQPLPKGMTFTALIEAILDHEEQSGAPRKTAR